MDSVSNAVSLFWIGLWGEGGRVGGRVVGVSPIYFCWSIGIVLYLQSPDGIGNTDIELSLTL